MPENKPVIGLKWEPKLPSLSDLARPSSSTSASSSATHQSSTLFMPSSQLIDGLYVPPNNPKKLNKLLRKQIKDTSGKGWFDMPAPVITPELKQDLKLLKLRGAMDPKRHYKKSDMKSKTLPKYFQIGTVVEHASEFYSARLTRKERKTSLADELLSDPSIQKFRKRKVRELEEESRPASNEKWRNKGKQTRKRAKERRHL